jgi:multidrug transporter EmrE-like cation transporter
MADTDLIAFAMWSGIAAVLMAITGIVYKSYQRKKII